MSRGLALPGLLLALSLGTAAVVLAVERYQSLRTAYTLAWRRERHAHAAREALFLLARDLRMQGVAGCHAGTDPADTSGGGGRAAEAWPWEALSRDADGHLDGLVLRGPGPMPRPARLVLSSCTRRDVLTVGDNARVESQAGRLRLVLQPPLPLGGESGHHLPSLELAAWRTWRYLRVDAAHGGWLVREEPERGQRTALAPAHAFSLSAAPGGWEIRLDSGEGGAWRLFVARRQGGWSLPVVLVLVFAAMLTLSGAQRLLLDSSRLLGRQAAWWPVLQRAEAALSAAEQAVTQLDALPGRERWFTAGCRAPDAPPAWRHGLCAHETGGRLPEGRGAALLAPCGPALCIRADGSARAPVCPAVPDQPLSGESACYVVELLDTRYRGQGGLYRITVRAWDRALRSGVTLQSHFVAGAVPERLAWRELW